jgi:class 3 adenylate cyclase
VLTCASCGGENPGGARFCNRCGASLVAAVASREVRKTVTAVFCDVTGSTALGEAVDLEALRALLQRYFERMRAIVEHHGGTVEKFIGDAVVAVFGVPVAHEDDALRACRAAVEMREALPELGVTCRIGVNTGEVMTTSDETLATGDAMNVAARLEQSAEPGEVLIGATTLELVRDAVVVEAVDPLLLKGKADHVPAFKLLSVPGPPDRAHASRFVGRVHELATVEQAWSRAITESSCELLTVVGDAGVGKSRLVAEALERIDARVLRGRCLPLRRRHYVLACRRGAEAARDAAHRRRSTRRCAVAAGGERAADHSRRDLLGIPQAARGEPPLVVCLDDLQWGEELFLDLVESTALLSTGAPVFLLCMARPELLERRPAWASPLRLAPTTRSRRPCAQTCTAASWNGPRRKACSSSRTSSSATTWSGLIAIRSSLGGRTPGSPCAQVIA